MVNAELIEYAKNQLKAGSSANYIRTVLTKQGWSKRDVDDALGIAQSEVGPPPAAAAAVPVKAKPEAPAGKNKSLAIAGILTAALFIISALLSILKEMGSPAVAFDMMPWATAVIQLLAGIFWIILGIKELRK